MPDFKFILEREPGRSLFQTLKGSESVFFDQNKGNLSIFCRLYDLWSRFYAAG